ncbi:DUF3883 domain-containing protein [Paenibacillus sp. P13VS]|uniref:DUF3883 domain-containing protein n=1 Tax=Paenibacillus sp. P13VS TaxID=2697367 RepID=UPI00187B4B37|nr:DUF3883 domain-containing protein [Paenibacillus sp. P13VS]MBE7681484.1 DUF3883 domain-containing protein [Paenibacillus sp. P13VS]
MGEDWSLSEVNLIISDYISMLVAELRGEEYNKTFHAKLLQSKLSARSRGSIEFKHCNISAAMIEKGLPYINGYKPRGNYQNLVSEIIDQYLNLNTDVLALFQKEAQKISVSSTVEEGPRLLDLLEDSPAHSNKDFKVKRSIGKKYDFDGQDKKNRTLGDLGEKFVIEYEKARLKFIGREDLASHISWVSMELGDGEGYDIKSYNADGSERYIEVKTTNYGKCTQFYFTINELLFSENNRENYFLYRVFDFSKRKRLFILQGSLSSICSNTPTHFRGYF